MVLVCGAGSGRSLTHVTLLLFTKRSLFIVPCLFNDRYTFFCFLMEASLCSAMVWENFIQSERHIEIDIWFSYLILTNLKNRAVGPSLIGGKCSRNICPGKIFQCSFLNPQLLFDFFWSQRFLEITFNWFHFFS